METTVYNSSGKKSGAINLPATVFDLPWNADLVYQVVQGLTANARRSLAHTKGRGEVRGGGKKPWRQKGTGRARHGSSRSPIWAGGGVTHGPNKEKNYSQKINQKMKTKALFVVLSQKLRDGEVHFIDDLGLTAPKTKTAAAILKTMATAAKAPTLAYKSGRRVLIAVPEATTAIKKSFSNLGGAMVLPITQLNPLTALTYKHLLLAEPEKTVALLSGRQAVKTTKTVKTVKTVKKAVKKTTKVTKSKVVKARK